MAARPIASGRLAAAQDDAGAYAFFLTMSP